MFTEVETEFPIVFQVVDIPAIVDIKVCGIDHFKRARERDANITDWLADIGEDPNFE